MDQPVKADGGKKNKIDKYEVESAVRTLLDAEKIKSNKELMKLVGPEIMKQHKAIGKISSIAQLRMKAGNMDNPAEKQEMAAGEVDAEPDDD